MSLQSLLDLHALHLGALGDPESRLVDAGLRLWLAEGRGDTTDGNLWICGWKNKTYRHCT